MERVRYLFVGTFLGAVTGLMVWLTLLGFFSYSRHFLGIFIGFTVIGAVSGIILKKYCVHFLGAIMAGLL